MPTEVAIDTTKQTLEFVVAPSRNEEMPGVRRFMVLSGLGQPEEQRGAVAGAFSFKSIIDALTGKGRPKALEELIKVAGQDDEMLAKITLGDLPYSNDVGKNEVLLKDAIEAPGGEIIQILLDEAKDLSRSNAHGELNIETRASINPLRLQRLARTLNIDSVLLENKNLAQLLNYFSELSKRVDEIEDFKAAEFSYIVTGKRVGQIQMLDQVQMQTGVECVLYATANLAQAASNQMAIVSSVSISEMQAVVPRGEGTNYRTIGPEWTAYLQDKGFTVHPDFNWAEALNAIENRNGGLVMRIFADHMIAIVGIRHSNTEPPQLEFCVANSLAGYWPQAESGRPVWVKALDVVARTSLLKAGQDLRNDSYLLTWDRLKD